MGAQASGDVEPVRWHALTTDRDGAPQRVKGVRGNPPLAGTYADLCACCCSREKIHHCTVCKETRPAFLMAMAPAPNQGQVATKCVRCAREHPPLKPNLAAGQHHKNKKPCPIAVKPLSHKNPASQSPTWPQANIISRRRTSNITPALSPSPYRQKGGREKKRPGGGWGGRPGGPPPRE